jgi:hypothetical protein
VLAQRGIDRAHHGLRVGKPGLRTALAKYQDSPFLLTTLPKAGGVAPYGCDSGKNQAASGIDARAISSLGYMETTKTRNAPLDRFQPVMTLFDNIYETRWCFGSQTVVLRSYEP